MKQEKYQRALLIDDDKIVNYVQESIINSFNIANEVITKDSAELALAYLKGCILSNNALPDIIFLDINMPVIDGFGFLEAFADLLKEHQYNWHKEKCKIIILTSSIDEDDFDNTPLLTMRGGTSKARRVFGELNNLLADLNEAVAT